MLCLTSFYQVYCPKEMLAYHATPYIVRPYVQFKGDDSISYPTLSDRV